MEASLILRVYHITFDVITLFILFASGWYSHPTIILFRGLAQSPNHSCQGAKGHQGTKASWSLMVQRVLKVRAFLSKGILYDIYILSNIQS